MLPQVAPVKGGGVTGGVKELSKYYHSAVLGNDHLVPEEGSGKVSKSETQAVCERSSVAPDASGGEEQAVSG